MGGVYGVSHYYRRIRIAPELVAKLRSIVARDGAERTARKMHTASVTITKILGVGLMQPAAAARLTAQIEALS